MYLMIIIVGRRYLSRIVFLRNGRIRRDIKNSVKELDVGGEDAIISATRRGDKRRSELEFMCL